ncbi:Uncharacterised protein [Burkholderia pseudomallei]|nr:Uncharacterised protein [Burkholderia pseudomallei]
MSTPVSRSDSSSSTADTTEATPWSHRSHDSSAAFAVCATKSRFEKPPRSTIWQSKNARSRFIRPTHDAYDTSRSPARFGGSDVSATPLAWRASAVFTKVRSKRRRLRTASTKSNSQRVFRNSAPSPAGSPRSTSAVWRPSAAERFCTSTDRFAASVLAPIPARAPSSAISRPWRLG